MTVALSIATRQIISVTVDSALMREFEDHTEYDVTQKAWAFPGVGCVATWGALTGNKIARFLEVKGVSRGGHSVDELALLVDTFLKQEYQPHKEPLEDVGYHVAGFDKQRRPRLHHVMWGVERPAPRDRPNPQEYHWWQHHPEAGQQVFLYNGRNDLAETVIKVLLRELQSGQDTRFDMSKSVDQIRFADFVLRFAAELTPQVAPPFKTFVLTPENQAAPILNPKLEPMPRDVIERVLKKLGIMS